MPLPLIAAGVGVGRAAYGIASNRKNTRKNRRFIQEAYRTSADRLASNQSNIRGSAEESLNARGLLQGGSEAIVQSNELNSTDASRTRPEDFKRAAKTETLEQGAFHGLPLKKSVIAKAMSTPTTLAGQQRANMEGEFGLEWKELDRQRKQGEADVSAAGQQGTVDAIASGVQTATSVYNAGQAIGQMGSMGAASGIRAAMTGVDDPGNWFGGINGLDPLRAPGSSWNRGGTALGVGQMNAEFNING